MRRALVLTDETARHPFRASLPPLVRQPVQGQPVRHWPSLRLDLSLSAGQIQDVKDFLLAYCACFIAVSLFIW